MKMNLTTKGRYFVLPRARALALDAVVILTTILLAACSGSGGSDAPAATAPATLPIPERVQAKINGTASNVGATISIDGGTPQEMMISGGAATFQANNLDAKDHTVVIKFYQIFDDRHLDLAQSTSTVTVVAGQTANLAPDALSYVTDSFDEDHDGTPNIDDDDNDNDGISDENEIAYNMNPFNQDSDGDGIKDADEVVSFVATIPTAVQARVTSEGVTIAATIAVDDGTESEMSLHDGSANFSIPGLAPGDHKVVITFYETAGSNKIELARLTSKPAVVAGKNVALNGDGYVTDFDADGDHISNIADSDNDNDGIRDADELAYHLNPFNADSNNDGTNDGIQIQLTEASTPVPAAVLARVTALGIEISAGIKIGDATEQSMQIRNNVATATIGGLLPRSTTALTITFYQGTGNSRIPLARYVNSSLTIAVGQTSILGAAELAYDVAFDRDNDHVNNIDDSDNDNDGIPDKDEARYVKNPFDKNSDNDLYDDADEVALQVSGSGFHTCVALYSGKVRCWGENSDSQLGVDNASPIFAKGITSAVFVRTSSNHSCAGLHDGRVFCWGSNRWNEISDDVVATINTPTEVADLAGATDVELTLGVTCGNLANNVLHCRGDVTNAIRSASGFDSNVIAAGPGPSHACVVRSDGTVSCYGNPLDITSYASGQLGNGTNLPPTLGPTTANVTNVAKVAVGEYHTCALIQGGTVQCWGLNDQGQAGDAANSGAQWSPVAVTINGTVIQLAVGGNHNCALLDTGSVFCWGSNDSGQLGIDSDADFSVTPTPVVDIANAISISAGESHSCAVLSNGRAMCWGENGDGQLGVTGASKPAPVTVSGF